MIIPAPIPTTVCCTGNRPLPTTKRRQRLPSSSFLATRRGAYLPLLLGYAILVRAVSSSPAFLRAPWMSRLSSSSCSVKGVTDQAESESPSSTKATTTNSLGHPAGGGVSPLLSNLNVNWGGAGATLAGGPLNVGGGNFMTKDVMSLDSIRSTLIRQEETIIFSLIERAQFRKNKAIYVKGALQVSPTIENYDFVKGLSFLEYVLLETEKVHATVRRYTSPEEHAFFAKQLPEPILPPLVYPSLLAPNHVDVNPQILSLYINEIVPAICKPGDDEQHGSSVLCDITALQVISRRIHLGKFVAETKFQENEEKYTRLVHAGDVDGVMELLTNREVEKRVLARAELKASTYGQDITGQTEERKVEPRVIAAIYRDFIIPLTKDVEVMYLFERVGVKPPQLPSSIYTLNP